MKDSEEWRLGETLKDPVIPPISRSGRSVSLESSDESSETSGWDLSRGGTSVSSELSELSESSESWAS